eukprot:TRINITY_DN136409_c0_g1_i1.p1 TRINITY_DN136409_c0_g1~~TRINITY_DN136409_c0_g1_i1.p1  ORF type:complete len:53 (+),score=3.62 TRINITY_DN136409_c0_g1_i1:50-208(+)
MYVFVETTQNYKPKSTYKNPVRKKKEKSDDGIIKKFLKCLDQIFFYKKNNYE